MLTVVNAPAFVTLVLQDTWAEKKERVLQVTFFLVLHLFSAYSFKTFSHWQYLHVVNYPSHVFPFRLLVFFLLLLILFTLAAAVVQAAAPVDALS